MADDVEVDPWDRLLTKAADQHQVVGSWQARDLKITRKTFLGRARSQRWPQLCQGVWALPGSVDSYERRVAAARLRTRNRAPATGATTLWLVGALSEEPDLVELWLAPNQHRDAPPGVRYRRGLWVAGDQIQRRRGVPTVPALRGLSDHAPFASVAQLERVLAAFDRLRIATPPEVVAYAERRGRFRGAPKLWTALESVGIELPHSGAERQARRLLWNARITPAPHRRPLSIEHKGRILGEIDLPWPDCRYGVEIDGPHHNLAEVIRADKLRDRQLARLDWIIDRFPVEELDQDPDGFVRQVRQGLQAAAAREVRPWT